MRMMYMHAVRMLACMDLCHHAIMPSCHHVAIMSPSISMVSVGVYRRWEGETRDADPVRNQSIMDKQRTVTV